MASADLTTADPVCPPIDGAGIPSGLASVTMDRRWTNDQLVGHALIILSAVSRTFNGISDVASSDAKSKLLTEGADLASQGKENFVSTLGNLLANPPGDFASAQDVIAFVERRDDDCDTNAHTRTPEPRRFQISTTCLSVVKSR